MIQLLPKTHRVLKKNIIEETIFLDQNEWKWKVTRVKDGFIVKFLGLKYFEESTFRLKTPSGECFQMENTNNIFFQDTSFERYYLVTRVIRLLYTDEIWETIETLLSNQIQQTTTPFNN